MIAYALPNAWLLLWWTIGVCAVLAVIAEIQVARRNR